MVLEASETCCSSKGNSIPVLLFRETERKKEGKKYASAVPLAKSSVPPGSLCFFLSAKVCLIHKSLITIAAAAPSFVHENSYTGSPSIFFYLLNTSKVLVIALKFLFCYFPFSAISYGLLKVSNTVYMDY